MIAYRPFPTELRIQAIGFTAPDPWSFDDATKIFIARLTFNSILLAWVISEFQAPPVRSLE